MSTTSPHFNLSGKRVFVAGHRGMVGSAIVRRLESENCDILVVGRDAVDLRDQAAVRQWMMAERPDAVILAAAKVGGILANDTYPADFIGENLAIQSNTIHSAFEAGVERLLFLGSSCIYPKLAAQPIREDALLTGPLEPTNEAYAIAKIAGLKQCQFYRRQHGVDYISAMPTNLYGPGDNFDLEKSHVIPALMRKVHVAKEDNASGFTIWGSGKPRREFLHVDDAADAMVWLLQHYSDDSHVNVGTGVDLTIRELAETIAETAGYAGTISTDPGKPDGTPQKLLDTSRLQSTGWSPRYDLPSGLAHTYSWFLEALTSGHWRA